MEQELTRLDPRWIAQIYKKTTGEDFLGLRAVQTNITGYLLPGIITITPRARYYPFYCWLLVEYGDSHPPGMLLKAFIKRREQIFVLANLAWSASSDDHPREGGLLGSTALGRHWQEHYEADVIPLYQDDYLDAPYGGYSQYTGVMRTLELTRERESGGIDILPKGQELARAFAKAVCDTRYYEQRTSFDTATSIPRAFLQEYGDCCHLSGLAASSDGLPTLESLFAFDVDRTLPPPDGDASSIGNMKGTLGLILDILNQASAPFSDDDFRRAVAYGLCADYAPYRPSKPLHPFLAHWQMFQLREYYVYALYALWVHFLHWLRREGPQTFQAFCTHLNQAVDLTASADEMGFEIPVRSPSEWTLREWLNTLLEKSDVTGADWEGRCTAFAQKSDVAPKEGDLYRLLDGISPDDSSLYVGLAWLLLSALYLRLSGLRKLDRWDAWYWARFAGARRRSMAIFVRGINDRLAADKSLLDTWRWLYRDYIIAQHVITALEKWRQRKANTFHFNYEQGLFEWVRNDRTGFSASRFRQAYDMLSDLGLYEIVPQAEDRPRLTKSGQQILRRVLEACND